MISATVPAGATMMHDAKRLGAALGLSNRDARSEVELLLTRALGIQRSYLIAHPEVAERAANDTSYRQWFERRLAGEPVAYIFGEREFYGCALSVTPAVLIPRPETELLVELALARIPETSSARILDLGTGSGAVMIAIASVRPNVELVATDVSAGALSVASANATRLLRNRRKVRIVESDWFAELEDEKYDLIVSNPPYVAEGDPHLAEGDLRFEPQHALVGGVDGLGAIRKIVTGARSHLHTDGWLLFEHGYDQADACRNLLEAAGYFELLEERDLGGVPRVAGGRWLTCETRDG